MIKKLLSYMVIMLLLTSNISRAEDVTCKGVINSCNKALKDKDNQIQIRDLRIKDSESQINGLNKTVQDQDSKLSSIFRNPWVYLVVGLAVGVYVGKR